MCTVLLAWRVWPGADLLVAANRDERLDRLAAPPAASRAGDVPIFCPRDLEAGGTWIGVNARGVVVALTNRFGTPADRTRRSRGELVLLALGAASADEAAGLLQALDPGDFNGFHCLVADREAAAVVRPDGPRMRRDALGAGQVHVVTERSFGAAPSRRVAWLEAQAARLAAGPEPSTGALAALLGTHAEAMEPGSHPIDGVCVHLDGLGYGTRSAEILRIATPRAASQWHHVAGTPCTVPPASLGQPMREALKW
ncbi:MAG: NRDE family protein [Deltaproteobacteria bacterium]|nr:NRDE family protein [Deltaproteobacteria bacterium]